MAEFSGDGNPFKTPCFLCLLPSKHFVNSSELLRIFEAGNSYCKQPAHGWQAIYPNDPPIEAIYLRAYPAEWRSEEERIEKNPA